MARKATERDLGHSIRPSANGDGQKKMIPDIGPQVGAEPRATSPFPPIAEYAFLSDCEVNCLIAPSGRVEWMCLPRADSASVFGAILDRAAGSFAFGPTGVQVPAGRRYLPGTLVLETTWRTRTGWLIVRDALCMGAWYHQDERSIHHRRPPTDYDAEHMLLRTVRCLSGSVELAVDCEPVFDYGQAPAVWDYEGSGYNRAVARAEGVDIKLHLSTDLRLGIEGRRASALRFEAAHGAIVGLTLRLAGGKNADCVVIVAGKVEIGDCDISAETGGACVNIMSRDEVLLRKNSIHDGGGWGVFAGGTGIVTLEENEIVAHAYSGLTIMRGAYVLARGNRITRNAQHGVRIDLGGGGSFEDNDLRGNFLGAWNIDPKSFGQVLRERNKG